MGAALALAENGRGEGGNGPGGRGEPDPACPDLKQLGEGGAAQSGGEEGRKGQSSPETRPGLKWLWGSQGAAPVPAGVVGWQTGLCPCPSYLTGNWLVYIS